MTMAVSFDKTIPILRIFDLPKAKEFYVDFLGFAVDWEHHFDDHSPPTCSYRGETSSCTSASITAIAAPARRSSCG